MSLLEQLFQWQHDLSHLSAEITLALGAVLVLIVGLFNPARWIIKAVMAVALIATLLHLTDGDQELFEGFLEPSRLALLTTDVLVLATLVLLVFPLAANQRSSYYFILLIILLGAIFMMQSQHLLLIYLAVEIVSYGSYILTNFSFKRSAHEAGIKYLLFGGVSSAVMLFGISILYGTSGGLLISGLSIESPYEIMGFCMFLIGVLFKISAVPMHIWVPNVYQEAPGDTTAFLTIVPKLAGLVLLHNVLARVGWGSELVLVIGMVTILVGTLGALRQTNFRRLLAYGAIAHSGFLIPLVVLDVDSSLFIWYATIYMIMNLGVFYAAKIMEQNGVESIEDYTGLGKKIPILGVGVTLILIALVGLPPTAGFTAKWLLFSALWSEYQLNSDPILLTYLLVAVFATAIALFYYLRIPYFMFLKEGAADYSLVLSRQLVVLLFGVFLLVIFFAPGILNLLI